MQGLDCELSLAESTSERWMSGAEEKNGSIAGGETAPAATLNTQKGPR